MGCRFESCRSVRNRSSMAEQRKHTLVAGSPVIVSLADNSPAGNLNPGAELVATAAPIAAVHTLEQVSSVVKTRVTSPVRRCGPGHHRVQGWRDGELAKSRRHLECRSFKPERRTTTPGLIVPRLGFVSSVGCLSKTPTWRRGRLARRAAGHRCRAGFIVRIGV